MPVVSDFVVIELKKGYADLGDSGEEFLKEKFRSGGRVRNDKAMLMFMVKGLTGAGDADVFINDQRIGGIQYQPDDSTEHWSSQIITFDGSILNSSGYNELHIPAKPNPKGGDSFDDFRITSIVCFFHQNA